MNLAVLPFSSGLTVCDCRGETVTPICDFPVETVDMWCWAHDYSGMLIVDQAGKRVTTYRLEDAAWTRTMSPVALPKDVKASCVAMKGEHFYVGASSIWMFKDGEWCNTPMPDFARGDGKHLDDLLLDGDRLIAVDNLVFPKWNVEYDVSDPAVPVYVRAEEIRANGSYERIVSASAGDHWMATRSRSIGRSGSWSYCTLFDKSTLLQSFAYSYWGPGVITRLAFAGDVLYVLDGQPTSKEKDAEIIVSPSRVDLRGVEPIVRRRPKERPKLTPIETTSLTHFSHFVVPADRSGVYVVGQSGDDEVAFEWIPNPQLTEPLEA